MVTREELNYRIQSWSLNQKIDHTLGVIDQFYNHTQGKVYIAFSGGKDSLVLLSIIRKWFDRDVKAVFCNTGNEYPSIVKFVYSLPDITVIHPDMKVREVIEKYGFPVPSKEQAKYIREIRHTKSEHMRNLRLLGRSDKPFVGKISEKWKFLIHAPFEVTDRCCFFLKKSRSVILRKLRV